MFQTIERYFDFKGHGVNFKSEIRAGFTTFLTLSYILFVNPSILSGAIKVPGVDVYPQLMTATALAAALGSLLMGMIARYPFALAPGMGINAYFTYVVVGQMGMTWQQGLGATFLSGLIFTGITIVGFREQLVNAIPYPVKIAATAGIGLFLALIGLKNSGIIVGSEATLVTLGDLSKAGPILTLLGFIIMVVLLFKKVRGAIAIGMLLITLIAILTEVKVFQGKAFEGFKHGLIQAPQWPTDIGLSLDIGGAMEIGLLGVIFVFLFVDLFDTAGTLLGLSYRAGYTKGNEPLPRASKAFLADAIATVAGSTLGTTSTTTYVESASGIEDGGRTGFTSVVVAGLFVLSIFFWPLASAIPAAATAPALIMVGALMMSSLGNINWDNVTDSVPAFLTIIMMPLSFSIANGLSAGILSYVLIKALTGEAKKISKILYLLSILLIGRYAYIAG